MISAMSKGPRKMKVYMPSSFVHKLRRRITPKGPSGADCRCCLAIRTPWRPIGDRLRRLPLGRGQDGGNRPSTQRFPDCSNDGEWPRPDFFRERRKLTLARTAIAPKVRATKSFRTVVYHFDSSD
jgi:hypothetical protein